MTTLSLPDLEKLNGGSYQRSRKTKSQEGPSEGRQSQGNVTSVTTGKRTDTWLNRSQRGKAKESK